MSSFLEALPSTLRSPLGLAGLVGAAAAAGLVAYGVARAPGRVESNLGPRGLRRQLAIAKGDWFASVEPLLRWLGARLSGMLPGRLHRALDRRLALAGDWLGLTAEEYVVLVIAGVLVGLGCGALYAGYNGAGRPPLMAGAFAGWLYVRGLVDSQIARRRRELANGLPYVVDLLALGMTAGLDFPGAVRQVVERSSVSGDSLTYELERILQELSLGHTRKHALAQLGDRTDVPAVLELVYAVVQAEERGSPLVDVLAAQAQVARQKRSAQAEEGAARAQQAMSLPLMLMAASAMTLLIVPMLIKVTDMFAKLGGN